MNTLAVGSINHAGNSYLIEGITEDVPDGTRVAVGFAPMVGVVTFVTPGTAVYVAVITGGKVDFGVGVKNGMGVFVSVGIGAAVFDDSNTSLVSFSDKATSTGAGALSAFVQPTINKVNNKIVRISQRPYPVLPEKSGSH